MAATPRTRFMRFIPVDGAVTALGYFQASVAVVGILFVLRSIIVNLNYLVTSMSYNDYYDRYALFHIIDRSFLLLVLSLYLTLAIFLLVGVKKRRAGYVLTYFVLGLMSAMALAIYWLVRMLDDARYFIYEGAIEIFLSLCVYSLFLIMAYLVYRNIKLEMDPDNMIYSVLRDNGADNVKKEVV